MWLWLLGTENLPNLINFNTHMNPGDRQREVVLTQHLLGKQLSIRFSSFPSHARVKDLLGQLRGGCRGGSRQNLLSVHLQLVRRS